MKPTLSSQPTCGIIGHVEEVPNVLEVQIGTWEPYLDKLPNPFNGCTICNVGCVCVAHPTSEQGHKLEEGINDQSSRVTAAREWSGRVTVGKDCDFYRVPGST